MPTTREEQDAAYKAEDEKRPLSSTKGQLRMYSIGLTPAAPFEYITVPTVVMRGTVRGKCVEVPKHTGMVRSGAKGVLVHQEAMVEGRFEQLYDIEVEGFIKYVTTHVFRKTSTYEVPETGPDGKANGKKKSYWRAEIEPRDPGLQGGDRSLHDEEAVASESIASYVWITPVAVDKQGKPHQVGASPTIAEQQKAGTFFFDLEQAAKAKKREPVPQK